jgi:hypothetical protein
VWFTTVAATLLALASAFLAAASVWVGYEQADIANIQAKIARAQALPVLEVRITQIQDLSTALFKNNVLQVDCVEGRVFNFRGDVAYFLDFTGLIKKPPIKTIPFSIPVAGYYDSSFVSPSTKGRLLTMTGHDSLCVINTLAAVFDNLNAPRDVSKCK